MEPPALTRRALLAAGAVVAADGIAHPYGALAARLGRRPPIWRASRSQAQDCKRDPGSRR